MWIALHLGWMICLDYWETLDSWACPRSRKAWSCHEALGLQSWNNRQARGKPGQWLFWAGGTRLLIPSHSVHPPCGVGRPTLHGE